MPLSVVIPVHGNKVKLYKLLESIRVAERAASDEVIVIDDCSAVDLLSDIRNRFDFVRVVRLPRKGGPAVARNKGAEEAVGDIVLFLDSDVIIKKDTILKVKATLESGGIVALEGEYSTMPANPGFFPRYKALEYRSFVTGQKYITVFGPRIAAIKRDIFLALGGFNPSYATASVEDYEFSYRLHDKGYKIHYDKTLEVDHHHTENLMKQFGLAFDRTAAWAKLFVTRRKFDNFGTTFAEGMGRLAGFIFVVSLPLLFRSKRYAALSVFLFVLYLFLNRRFFKLVLREEGPFFLIKSVCAHLLISVVIASGFIYGILTSRHWRGRK